MYSFSTVTLGPAFSVLGPQYGTVVALFRFFDTPTEVPVFRFIKGPARVPLGSQVPVFRYAFFCIQKQSTIYTELKYHCY